MARPNEFNYASMDVVHRALVQRQSRPSPVWKRRSHPLKLRRQRLFFGREARNENGEAIGHATKMRIRLVGPSQVLWREHITALRRTHSCERNELRQVAVSLTILRQQDEANRVLLIGGEELKIRANGKRQLLLLRLHVGAHDSRQRALVS